jgi:integrase
MRRYREGRVFQRSHITKTGQRASSPLWWIEFWLRGKRYAESSKSTSRAIAVKLLNKRKAAAGSGQPFGPNIEKTTFTDLEQILLNDFKANGKPLKRMAICLDHLREFFGFALAADITSDRITAYIAHRQEQPHRQGDRPANATINREQAALRRAFNLARKAGRVARVPEIEMLAENNTRKGFFERDQFERVREHLPADIQPLATVAYHTGWRIASELLTRQWRHVDLDNAWLRLDPGETKNGDGREFPLEDEELRQTLVTQLERTRELEKATGQIIPWVFHRNGKPIKDFRGAWKAACRQAGVQRIGHDFRRTAVRNLERAGAPRSAAMRMTGHKTESVYRRYAITDAAMLKEAGQKAAAFNAAQRESTAAQKKSVNFATIGSIQRAEERKTI